MIPDILNPEIHVTTIELQNEIKSTEIQKSDTKSFVKNREIIKQENAKEHESNAENINVTNVDTPVSNIHKHGFNAAVTNIYRMEKVKTNFRKVIHGYSGNNKRGMYPKDYWVQFNIAADMPEGSSPMDYDSSRNSFLAIVFTITLVMLVLTTCIVGYVYFSDDLRDFFIYDGKLFLFLGMGGMMALNYAFMCSTCTRVLPCNIIVLLLAVFFMSLIAAYVTAFYTTDIIFFALVATVITVLVCLCLALTSVSKVGKPPTKKKQFDFTNFLLYVIAISVAFGALVLILSIVALTTGVTYKPLYLVILVIGTILNVVILIMELQMIIGGRTVEISEDDWALAAFMLYTSIVDIFLKFVQLLSAVMDD